MTDSQRRATVLMSGGIDSASCGHLLQSQGILVSGLFIDYGQAAAKLERVAVAAMAEHLHIPLMTISVSSSDKLGPGELVGRNAMLISTALFVTGAQAGVIGIGIHAGTSYYDCSEQFLSRMDRLVAEQTDGRVSLAAPFISWRKADIYDYFLSAALPISLTYSCEAGGQPPCGLCASCRDRRAIGC